MHLFQVSPGGMHLVLVSPGGMHLVQVSPCILTFGEIEFFFCVYTGCPNKHGNSVTNSISSFYELAL